MQLDSGERESHTPRGAIDVAKLDAFRDAFVSIEPVSSGTIDDRVDPRELRLTIPYGVGDAAETKFTVRWTAVGDYNVHYSDTSDHNLRWDIHSHKFSIPPDDRHFHSPPDASNVDEDVDPSCIDANRVALVARAVHLLWRQALDEDTLDSINAGTNPP